MRERHVEPHDEDVLERARRVARAFGLVLARRRLGGGEFEGPRVRGGLRRVVVAAQLDAAQARRQL